MFPLWTKELENLRKLDLTILNKMRATKWTLLLSVQAQKIPHSKVRSHLMLKELMLEVKPY